MQKNICLWALALAGAFLVSNSRADTNAFMENFTGDPSTNGWRIFGDASLFQWDSTNHDLVVTWDSSRLNSYFYHALPSVLGLQDAFSLSFDLTLSNAVAGGDFGFELAIGLFNLADAAAPGFLRGTGYQSPNLVEFDYFPPYSNYTASIDATMADDQNDYRFVYDPSALLANGVTYNVAISHSFGDALVTATVSTYDTNGQLQLYTSVPYSYYAGPFTDYFVDTLSISSYSGEDADGFILASGTVGNIVLTTTTRPVGNVSVAGMAGPVWQSQFTSRTNWSYTLLRSMDFQIWTPVSSSAAGTGSYLTLQDTNAPPDHAYYRVQASQP